MPLRYRVLGDSTCSALGCAWLLPARTASTERTTLPLHHSTLNRHARIRRSTVSRTERRFVPSAEHSVADPGGRLLPVLLIFRGWLNIRIWKLLRHRRGTGSGQAYWRRLALAAFATAWRSFWRLQPTDPDCRDHAANIAPTMPGS